ncbi:hypothetical protein [Streptomyces sp. CAI-85]|uniref:hypothetical protein n=1 Tax=Streptomyces sp. CAI-85 TaxID=1472662 RepID=UPI001587A522|nr:hypothetical protein [Streptomyces sp. CAI-85]NUV60823.1 hypothetical protein [Streptomyces sp. CAI-85]
MTVSVEVDEYIERGIKTGFRRLRTAHLRPRKQESVIETVRRSILSYIDAEENEELTGWFWEFAADALVIAVGARSANRESRLKLDELHEYIEILAEYSNSFRHS